MKYTNRKIYRRKRRKRAKRILIASISLFIILCIVYIFKNSNLSKQALNYNTLDFDYSSTQKDFLVDEFCVSTNDVISETFETENEFYAVALFDINNHSILHAKNIHNKIYPASTTKILTAYLALEYGELSDVITISENATSVPTDSSKAGLKVGDKASLETLLYGLMLPSGNDSAVAIAEYISGSEDAFVELMNKEAKKLGATNTNFTSPHGYPDENHYTTAYDMYLIFNECIKNDKFIEIVSSSEYKATIQTGTDACREIVWKQSNQFLNGMRNAPDGVTIIGGKTGTTNEAGSCLILYSKINNCSYISIIMGAQNKPILYQTMSDLLLSSCVIDE